MKWPDLSVDDQSEPFNWFDAEQPDWPDEGKPKVIRVHIKSKYDPEPEGLDG